MKIVLFLMIAFEIFGVIAIVSQTGKDRGILKPSTAAVSVGLALGMLAGLVYVFVSV